ncbi:serine/arginine repetitive matrix protein 1-like [Achroia grisella]|uniref:serine/arginine repetitive matrix protein 1-like n=1 Tax=Achroia grisella TaxID=688607 RepID=UPI0027D324FA|nr:serine/arginine repetitive matrix protein 1-like [Achroia grisella]
MTSSAGCWEAAGFRPAGRPAGKRTTLGWHTPAVRPGKEPMLEARTRRPHTTLFHPSSPFPSTSPYRVVMSQRGKAPRKPPDRGAPRTVVRRDLRNPTKLVPATELGTFHARPASKGTPSALAGSGNDAADREPGRGERCAQPGPSKRRAPPSPTSPARVGYRAAKALTPSALTLPPPDSGSEEEGGDRRFYGDVHASPATSPEPSPAPSRVPSPLPRSYTLDRGEYDATSYAALEPVPQSPEPMLPPGPSPRRRTPPSFAAVVAGPATPTPATTAPAPQMPSQGKVADTGVEPATGRGKYPPIVVERLPNWTRHFDQLRRVLGEAPNARPYGTGVRFLPRTDEEFRAVQRYLIEASEKDPTISWYFYSLASELPTKVAIRGLPADTPNERIVEALQEKGDELTRLYATDELLYMRGVVVEAWKPASVLPQCHRCQAFGHASANCHRPVKCVRCGGEHPAANCDRPRDQKPTCANCAKPHTANDRKCPVYKREARQRGIKPRPPVPTASSTAPKAQQRRRNNPTAAPRTYVAQAPPPVITVEETAGANLMAPANEPTQRGADAGAIKKRRRRRRGKKRRGDEPVTASTPIPFLPDPTPIFAYNAPPSLPMHAVPNQGPRAAPRRRQAAPPAHNVPRVAFKPLLADVRRAPPAPPTYTAYPAPRSARAAPAPSHKRPSTEH